MPFGPTTPTRLRGPMVSETRSSSSWPPMLLLTCLTLSTTDEATEAKTLHGHHFPARYPVVVADFIDDARQRVIIYDGATGTNLQLRHLGPDDFGGAAPRGLQRGARRHPARRGRRPAPILLRRRLSTWSRPTASAPCPGCWPSTASPTGPGSWPPSRPASPGTWRAGYGPGRWVAGSLGPGTKIASLGQITFVEQRDGYQEAAAGLLDGGVDLLIIETVQDLLQAKAAIIGCRRAMAAAGRQVPIQVQVTIEHDRPHAHGHRDRRRPHHPRRPAARRHRAQLRHRAPPR